MMNDALNLIYYFLDRFLNFMFGSYFFEGVSIGMLLVVGFIFTVLLQFLLAVPRVHIPNYSRFGGNRNGSKEKN